MTTIHLFNTGEFLADLGEWFRVEPEDVPNVAALQTLQRGMLQALVVDTADGVVLIDAPLYDENGEGMLPIPGYVPPLPLHEQLVTAGIAPERVDHVIITHAHADHFNGLTVEQDDEWQPVYPNAMHYLGQDDWNTMQHKLYKSDSLESRTFGVLHRLGQLTLISDETEIVPGVTVIPAPGESAGHQIVRVALEEDVLYHIGDLIHHEVEIEQPEWACWWADQAQHQESRQRLLTRALAEDALLVASHIAGVGRLRQTDTGLRWLTVAG